MTIAERQEIISKTVDSCNVYLIPDQRIALAGELLKLGPGVIVTLDYSLIQVSHITGPSIEIVTTVDEYCDKEKYRLTVSGNRTEEVYTDSTKLVEDIKKILLDGLPETRATILLNSLLKFLEERNYKDLDKVAEFVQELTNA